MARAIGSSSFSRSYRLDAPAAPSRARTGSRGATLVAEWLPLAALAADSAPWRDLVGRTLEPNVFLEPEFASAALAADLGGAEIGAVTVRADTRLVGLLPGRVEGFACARLMPAFVAWTHPFAPLSTPLVDRESAADVVAAMLDYLPWLPGSPRAALFPLIAEEGAVARLIAGGRRIRPFAVHQRAALMPGKHAGLAASSGKLKELRRQRRRLAELGEIALETATTAREVEDAVARYLQVEAAGWKGRTGSAAMSDQHATQFLTDAVTGLANEGKARVDLLKLDGRAIAAAITLLAGDYAWFWKTAYDETFARFSPGVQLALELTEALSGDARIALVDSCAVADHPMIDHLWSGRRKIADWLVPLGGLASFAAAIAAEHARRALVARAKTVRDRLRR